MDSTSRLHRGSIRKGSECMNGHQSVSLSLLVFDFLPRFLMWKLGGAGTTQHHEARATSNDAEL